MPLNCRRDGCTETVNSRIALEFHLKDDHDDPEPPTFR